MQARATAGKNANKNNQNTTADINGKNENCENAKGENEAAGIISARLGGFFAFMLEICDDADKISHAAPLASFSDMLAEKYLWPQSDEDDEVRWEEHFYDDELFYSLYFYSRAVLDATGVDFAQFKPGPGGVYGYAASPLGSKFSATRRALAMLCLNLDLKILKFRPKVAADRIYRSSV